MRTEHKRTLAIVTLTAVMMWSYGCTNFIPETSYEQTSETAGINEEQLMEAAGITVAGETEETSESSEETAAETTETTELTEPPKRSVLVTFIGDLTLCSDARGGHSARSFNNVVKGDMDYCFDNCKDIFAADDLTIANLEGAVTTRTGHKQKQFVFKMAPENMQMLNNASIEAVNLANNHSMDFYEAGYQDTKDNLDSYGIVWSDQKTSATYKVGDYLIGMFGICDWDNANDAYNRIEELKQAGCNIIIATCHWGTEATYQANSKQIYLGHQLIDRGCDIVIGGHPHRLQPIEKYNGKWIAYSISNFCFGGNLGLSDPDTVILQCEFVMDESTGKCVNYKLNVIPYCQTSSSGNDFHPVAYEWGSSRYYRVLSRLGWSQEDE
ncbi:poly-gamma-glutamate synthesis protein (capsule biosynthesis protein) [Ruminococcaceae bacterium YRB3002]|nr:poly-gamma-glutamate synthesis protein (capsule biosynthesis protein) [Ruminococcaceae bacterium YRB3002]